MIRRLLPAFLGLLAIAWAIQAVMVWFTHRVHVLMGMFPE